MIDASFVAEHVQVKTLAIPMAGAGRFLHFSHLGYGEDERSRGEKAKEED